jgi:RNA polymerase sigma-70 factor (ECF subfamily)
LLAETTLDLHSSDASFSGQDSYGLVVQLRQHEPSLRSWLTSKFPTIGDVDDIIQESYLRIWRMRAAKPIESIRGFFFTVARHVAHDELRRRRRSPIDGGCDVSAMDVPGEQAAGAKVLGDEERVRLLVEAIDRLPSRCREVVVLRKLHQLSQKEVAERLGITEKGVENQLARGMARCRAFFHERGIYNWDLDC